MVVPNEQKNSDDAQARGVRGGVKEAADAAGKTVVAAALAGAVVTGAAAVTPDQINLPDPTPIVQTLDQPVDLPDQTPDDHADKKSQNIKRLWQFLKFMLVALALLAGVFFGMISGCAGCAGQCAAPVLQDASSSADASTSEAEASAASH